MTSSKGELFSKKKFLFKIIKSNPGYNRNAIGQLANNTNINETAIDSLLASMESEGLIQKKKQAFRQPIYEAIADEIPEPNELSKVFTSSGAEISDQYSEDPDYADTQIPEPVNFNELDAAVDMYIEHYEEKQ